MLGQERLAEPRNALGAGQVGPRDEAAEAPVARGVPGEEDQVRTSLALGDAPEILLHDHPMARQAPSFRARPGRIALASHGHRLDGRRSTTTASEPTPRDHDAAGVGDRRIEELDLQADDGPEAGLLRRGGKSDHAVQPEVIGDPETP